jgi:hypothetical protein
MIIARFDISVFNIDSEDIESDGFKITSTQTIKVAPRAGRGALGQAHCVRH